MVFVPALTSSVSCELVLYLAGIVSGAPAGSSVSTAVTRTVCWPTTAPSTPLEHRSWYVPSAFVNPIELGWLLSCGSNRTCKLAAGAPSTVTVPETCDNLNDSPQPPEKDDGTSAEDRPTKEFCRAHQLLTP